MDKQLFELQVQHNHFVRTFITSICKIFLWSLAYVFLLNIVLIFTKLGSTWATSSTYNPTKYNSMVNTISGAIILIVSVVYIIIVVAIIISVLDEHKNVTKKERIIYSGKAQHK